MSTFIESYGLWAGIGLVIGQIVLFMLVLSLALVLLIHLDRKTWAAVMMRKGPNVVGPFGLFQNFADAGKFLLKEIIIPAGANKTVFIIAPILTLVLAFGAWAVIPVAPGSNAENSWVISDLNVGILYLFAVSSLGVYGCLLYTSDAADD